jgi:hypothetical protein|tara:strand:- start:174 stop:431 length:258 start_codon:yes stop_codon:yes gene_type:complete
MTKDNFYEDILNNFDAFCDQFEAAAAQRFTGQDDDSRKPIDDERVQRATPTAAREVRATGIEGEGFRKPPIDVQAASLPKLPEDL